MLPRILSFTLPNHLPPLPLQCHAGDTQERRSYVPEALSHSPLSRQNIFSSLSSSCRVAGSRVRSVIPQPSFRVAWCFVRHGRLLSSRGRLGGPETSRTRVRVSVPIGGSRMPCVCGWACPGGGWACRIALWAERQCTPSMYRLLSRRRPVQP